MQFRDRALRRHHRQRRIYAEYKKWLQNEWCSREHALVTARQQLRTICSCDMCGNPRHNGWTKLEETGTMQERKALDLKDFDY